jgi:hypothetical protein
MLLLRLWQWFFGGKTPSFMGLRGQSTMTEEHPSGAKSPDSSLRLFGTTEQLAEKVRFLIRNPQNIPQGLKPRLLE